jgi:hypothetical protein
MKHIIKNFNNLIKRTIFKVKNKTNNNFNKYLITFICLLFFYLFYLLIPLHYDKTWVQTNIKSKLLNEFKINISNSSDISYRILPAPHFLIKNSKILVGETEKQKSIAEIKDLKVFLSQGNFFDKKEMNLQEIVINGANFTLLRSDLKLLNEFKSKKFSNKKIKINNSNIFLKDNLGEIISIIKIGKIILFFDDEKLLNFFNLKGEVFNMPFTFEFMNRNNPTKYEKINFNSKSLKLDIFNESVTEKNILVTGENTFSLLNFKINTKYKFKEKLIIFESDNSRLDNAQARYTGELSINPFDLSFNIYLDNYKISKLFNNNFVLIEFIKSGLLFNDNISVNTSLIINSNQKNEIFQDAKINFHIINGKIDFNKTQFVNDDIGSLQISNSNLFFRNNELVFNSDILIDIKNSEHLFSLLNTNKLSRKNFQTILINLDYNFLSNKFKFNNVKIDNSDVNSQLLRIIDGFNDNDQNNFNKSRRLINELLDNYEG